MFLYRLLYPRQRDNFSHPGEPTSPAHQSKLAWLLVGESQGKAPNLEVSLGLFL